MVGGVENVASTTSSWVSFFSWVSIFVAICTTLVDLCNLSRRLSWLVSILDWHQKFINYAWNKQKWNTCKIGQGQERKNYVDFFYVSPDSFQSRKLPSKILLPDLWVVLAEDSGDATWIPSGTCPTQNGRKRISYYYSLVDAHVSTVLCYVRVFSWREWMLIINHWLFWEKVFYVNF